MHDSGVSVSVAVEHRVLRIGRWFEVQRHRPRRLEVQRGGQREVIDLPRAEDPWVRAALGALVLCVASSAVIATWRAVRVAGR